MQHTIRPNRVKEMHARGEPYAMALLSIASPDLVEIYGRIGYELLRIEGEHGIYDESLFMHIVRTAELWNMTPTIRVRTLEQTQIARLLDLGIQGIHYTHVRTGKDAADLVRFAKYPPEGERGFGRYSRLNGFGLVDEEEAIRLGNETVFLSVAIEDPEGAANIDEILAVKGIDEVRVGASDLVAAMGHPGQYDHPEVQEMLKTLREKMSKFPHTLPPSLTPFGESRTGFSIAGALADLKAQRDAVSARRIN